jgi:hypothetical protein
MAQENERSEAEARERGVTPPAISAAPLGGDLLTVERPAAGVAKVIDPSGFNAIRFAFGLDDARVVILDVDVVLVFPDGGRLIMPAFMMQMITAEPPKLSFGGVVIDPQAVIAAAGDVRLADPLPQLAMSDEARPPEKPPETPAAPPVVQMPAAQTFANTPAPRARPFPTMEGAGESDSLQEGNARFARRINHEEIQGSSLKSEGSLTASTEKSASTAKGPEKDPASVIPDNANAPVITSFGSAKSVTLGLGENGVSVARITATDQETPETLLYSVVGGADADKFAINSKTGQLYFVNAPNFEAPGSSLGGNGYKVVVEVSDGSRTDRQQLTVNIGNVNEAPIGAALSAATVAENAANGTLVGTVTATDPDAGGTHSYAFVPGGNAGGRFSINAATGAVTVNQGNLIDFETSPEHAVVVRVTDQGGLSTEKAFIITVTDANDAPIITSNGGGSSGATSLSENVSLVTTVTSTDPDLGNIVTYSIAGGADAGLFTINPASGALTFVTPPDFEVPTDADGNNIYEVIVRASDGLLSDTQAISVTVVDANDPPVITSNGGGAAAATTAAENGNGLITTITATDVDPGATITFAITGGADAAKFAINSITGALRFLNPTQDFENPDDANGDGVYDVVVQALDGQGGTDTQVISVALADINDAPIITSNGGGATTAVTFIEGSGNVTTVAASDQDAGAVVTFVISGGADAAKFTINPATGVLTFVTPPDYETPTDVNGDNIYEVIVTADDGNGGLDTQTINVAVDDQNDPPAITSNGGGAAASVSMTENGVAVTTVTAIDPDVGAVLTYSIIGGADSAKFSINGATGALTFVSAPNFEAPTDAGGNNIYDVRVQVSDGTFTDAQDIAVTVTNQNEVPTITSNGGGASGAISMAENLAAVTTVTGTDPDAGATFSYSITGGADAGKFTINAATGALTFVTAPDFEAPSDVGANNVYDVVVQMSDGLGGVDTQALAVTITNANDAPVITSNGGGANASLTLGENITAVTTVTATDPDAGATQTYSIVGGADAAKFTINAATGALSFVTAADFDAPGDAGGNNIYDVTVRVSDGLGGTDDQAIAVTVTNANEVPVITSNGGGASAAISLGENISAVTTVTATDPDAGATQTYSIVGGADAATFSINAVTGALTFIAPPNFEAPTDAGGNNVYDVTVRVSDSLGGTDDQTIAVTVTNANEAPVITSNGGGASAAISVTENGTSVTTVTATDADAGATQTYSISGGADAARFTINAATGVLTFVAPPNFEAPTDAGGNNVYDVQVRVTDGTLTDTQDLAVTVTNQNETPVITSNGGGASAAISMAENGTAVTTVTATDVDAGATQTYSIIGGADAARFTINASTGVLTFVTGPDFEAPTDAGANNVYDVQVQVSDGTLTDTQTLAVTITNQNENPVITSNGAGAAAAILIAENGTAVTTVTATDPDAGASLTYSILGGADAARFTINASTGVLTFVAPPDFETPTDAGANNVYDVVVQVSDGTLTDTQNLAVTVTNQNDSPPVITSNGGGVSAAISQAENGTAVTTVTATDADPGAVLTYSIIGGADSAKFAINASTGVLTFVAPPDFESPTDVGANNVYDVQVQVSDGAYTDAQSIAVTITNQNEAPVITSNGGGASTSIILAENTTSVATVTATDPDAGATQTYSIMGGADAAKFTINAVTGALAFIVAPDAELPTDVGGNHVYDVVVRVSDGLGGTDDQAIAVTITNLNEAPVINSNGGGASAAISVTENGTAVTTVVATDPDAGASATYSISGGADAARFTINAATGALTFVAPPNFEAPTDAGGNNVYDVQVQVTDGTLTDTQDLAVTVTNQNEAPVITSNGGGASAAISIAENGSFVTNVTATDVDAGATQTYSIFGGADAARFTIHAATGALSFVAPPNFEAPTDAGADNVYDVTVRVSDSLGGIDDQAIAVTVTNVNDNPPVITSNGGGGTAGVSIAENGTAVTTVTSTDLDAGASRTFSLSGGADIARFTINAATGVLTFVSAPDFESPTDAGANNVYDVQVQVSDGTFIDTQDIAVTVTNQNEAPVITSNGGGATAAISVSENGTAVTTVTSTDQDAGATQSFSITGGADAARFSINAATGVLTFVTAQNFESPTDAGADNVYDVTVQISDGTLVDTQAIAVTVTNQNEAPVITSNGGGASAAVSLAENIAAVTTVTSTDPDAGAPKTFSILGGADAAKFSINAVTGVLSFLSAPDFETPTDAGANNVYDVQVQVSDGSLIDTQNIAVTVTNVGGVLIGDGFDNTLIGTSEEDNIQGLGGNDIIDGGLGSDTLFGGDGDDTLSGGAGFDHLEGGIGDDNIYSGTGDALIYGGDGNDRIYVDGASISIPGTWVVGGNGYDEVTITSARTFVSNDLTVLFGEVEKVDFSGAGVVANFTNMNTTILMNTLGTSGPGQTLTLDFDGNDTFTVAAGEFYTQSGNLYTFYSDVGMTNEIIRVNII